MQVYLLYGFRWRRKLIREYIVYKNIDDAAAEWTVGAQTSQAMLENFQHLYPDLMSQLPSLRFVEQYDPEENVVSQPYAYVAIYVHEIKLGADIAEVVKLADIRRSQYEAFTGLRDKLCQKDNNPLNWYIVVCGDEQRAFPAETEASESNPADSSEVDNASEVDWEEAVSHQSFEAESALIEGESAETVFTPGKLMESHSLEDSMVVPRNQSST